MQEIISVPASIRQRLQEARSLASQNRFEEADNVLRETGRALASAQPELCAALLASQRGYRGAIVTTTELTSNTVENKFVVLGITVATDLEVKKQAKTVVKRVEFF